MKFSQIVAALGDQVTTSSLDSDPSAGERTLTGLAAIEEAGADKLSYVESAKFASRLSTTQAGALILPNDPTMQAQASTRNILWISVKDPRLVFARAISYFYQPYRRSAGIHPSAVIEPGVEMGEDVAVGPLAVVHEGVKLGDRTCIHAGAVVYPGAMIGRDTVLHANCVVHERTQIGDNCVIHSGAVIGSEGFGFVPTATGWEKMHQSGITVIEAGVEIGCNSTVDRPAVGETRIGRNTKIDNMVHIAHSCQVGEAVAMAAQVGMAGGTTIGSRVILAGQVGIANKAKLGDGAVASAQSGIVSNVAPGEIVSGSPAMPHKTFLKSSAIIKRLPKLVDTVKQIQQRLNETND
ncbi:UDP-3-O-[3-hydroxymyristoyl] glucosamine N-acyltransferase [Synechococcus sp. PCC 7335]|uniref:UDP-3-O-(3-hydroxymyristoyl)glucosamine N-acyltransferase n=1 Tax=Synechococcus sp. (strain ATCC 29403 / PCC 7335) TaxID=91464 RepID=UPI00017ED9B5|nr:UDP-3-O-(3-hydroxymyristoyl)glucosamine N-acyltransferase [Synechococcus sp. PCC 7335]EDX84831.1 UDP-3-O-[3-hydroxymyristoyl] glucosamine N-acyltransferase [Synechococcus sp. PCC 7335]